MTSEEARKIAKIKQECYDIEGLSCEADLKDDDPCGTCSKAIEVLIADSKELEIYKNADLIERKIALQVASEDEEYCKCNYCNEKDYDSSTGIACIGDDGNCSTAIQCALENIPRFKPEESKNGI